MRWWSPTPAAARCTGPATGTGCASKDQRSDAPADVPGADSSIRRAAPVYPTAAGLVRAVDWTADPAPLIPLYLRRPDAKPSVVNR